jgi:hypothetical protein
MVQKLHPGNTTRTTRSYPVVHTKLDAEDRGCSRIVAEALTFELAGMSSAECPGVCRPEIRLHGRTFQAPPEKPNSLPMLDMA